MRSEGEHMLNTENDLINIKDQLPLLKMNQINWTFYQMLPLCGFGVVVAYSKFLALHNKICKAAFELTNAIEKRSDFFKAEELNGVWQQSIYLENAIIAYNSVRDLIYVTIYFRFELFHLIDKQSIENSQDILRLSKKVQGNAFSRIEEWLKNNEITHAFFRELTSYNEDTKELSNLANDLKHRGSFVFKGLELPRTTKVTKVVDGLDVDITECVTPPIIDNESEINNLIAVHRRAIDLAKKLYEVCDFEGCLQEFLNKAGLNKSQ